MLLVIAIVLSPSFTVVQGMYSPRGEDLILAGMVGVWFLALPLRRWDRVLDVGGARRIVTLTKIMAAMLYVGGISIGVGAIAFHQSLILSDLMILPMIARYWLILWLGQWAIRNGGQGTFLWALAVGLVVSSLVGVLQHFNVAGINDWLTPLYIAQYPHMELVGLQLVKLGHPASRVVGTHGDPRHYAYMLVVGVGFCIALLTNLRHRALQVTVVALFFLCLLALAFAASRTSVLSAGLVLLVAILLTGLRSKEWRKTVGLLAAIVAVLALVSPALESGTFAERVIDLEDTSYDVSFNARLRDLVTPFNLGFESPIIWLTGRGPSKAEVRTDSHDDYAWYFYRFGLPGLLLYLSLLFSGLKACLHAWRATDDPLNRAVGMTAFLAMINWTVFALAENIFKDPQLMALNMLLMGACIGMTPAEQKC